MSLPLEEPRMPSPPSSFTTNETPQSEPDEEVRNSVDESPETRISKAGHDEHLSDNMQQDLTNGSAPKHWRFEAMPLALEKFLEESFTTDRKGKTFTTKAHSRPMMLNVADKVVTTFFQNASVISQTGTEPFYAGIKVQVFNDTFDGQEPAIVVSYTHNKHTWGVASLNPEHTQRVHAPGLSGVPNRATAPMLIIPCTTPCEDIKKLYTEPYPFPGWVAEYHSDDFETHGDWPHPLCEPLRAIHEPR